MATVSNPFAVPPTWPDGGPPVYSGYAVVGTTIGPARMASSLGSGVDHFLGTGAGTMSAGGYGFGAAVGDLHGDGASPGHLA
jgi:hypothetical protein